MHISVFLSEHLDDLTNTDKWHHPAQALQIDPHTDLAAGDVITSTEEILDELVRVAGHLRVAVKAATRPSLLGEIVDKSHELQGTNASVFSAFALEAYTAVCDTAIEELIVAFEPKMTKAIKEGVEINSSDSDDLKILVRNLYSEVAVAAWDLKKISVLKKLLIMLTNLEFHYSGVVLRSDGTIEVVSTS